MTKIISTNPATNAILGEVSVTSEHEIREKIAQAHAAKKAWKILGAHKRAEMLRPLIKLIQDNSSKIATLTTQEMGRTLEASQEDVEWDLEYLKNFLDEGPGYIQNEITIKTSESFSQVTYEPIGVAAAIAPWNYPLSNFLWGVIPNLIVGNPVIFKHSEECPLSGKLFEGFMNQLSLPQGVFSEIYGDSEPGKILLEQNIDLIWFTGSSAVGKKLFEVAGKKQIKSILELGGSNPGIVFEDVEVDTYIERFIEARFNNCGQSCDALKRLIVHQSLYDEVIEKLSRYIEKIKVGDPCNPETKMGPLVSMKQLELLEQQVNASISLGAKVAVGGNRPSHSTGAFYLPTLLTDIKTNMPVWREEVFGPVLPVISFRDEEEAIHLANDTHYGLGANIFSNDIERARRVAAQIDAGSVSINHGSRWHPNNPFGGYKDSGKGREHGRYGFQELCQLKVIAE